MGKIELLDEEDCEIEDGKDVDQISGSLVEMMLVDCEDWIDDITIDVDSIEETLDNDESIEEDNGVDKNSIVGNTTPLVWFTDTDDDDIVWFILIVVEGSTDEVWFGLIAVIGSKIDLVWFTNTKTDDNERLASIVAENFNDEYKVDAWLESSDDDDDDDSDAWLELIDVESFIGEDKVDTWLKTGNGDDHLEIINDEILIY